MLEGWYLFQSFYTAGMAADLVHIKTASMVSVSH